MQNKFKAMLRGCALEAVDFSERQKSVYTLCFDGFRH